MMMFKWLTLCFLTYVVVIEGKLELSYFPMSTKLYVPRFGSARMYCEVTSDQPFKLSWYKNGELIDFSKIPPWHYISRDKRGELIHLWPFAMNRSRGSYSCVATNGVDPPINRTVEFLPKEMEVSDYPKFTNTFKENRLSTKQPFGTNITLNCEFSGGKNKQVFWFFRNLPLHQKSPDAPRDEEGFSYKLSNTNQTLHIFKLRKVHHSFIFCQIANDVGTFDGEKYYINSYKIEATPVKPKIIDALKNVSLDKPELLAYFSCNATGTPAPTYRWFENGRLIRDGEVTPLLSVVAMANGYVKCEAINKAGVDTSMAFITVYPLPFKPERLVDQSNLRTETSFTIKITAHYEELTYHEDIPITHAILDYKPWHRNALDIEPYQTRKIKLDANKPHGPWYYKWGNLRPNTKMLVRVQMVNKYGTGRSSEDWTLCQTGFSTLKFPVRNLRNIAHSNKSFTLKWDDPEVLDSPVMRYDLYMTNDPSLPRDEWLYKVIVSDQHSYTHNWEGTLFWFGNAPVIYWKISIFGIVRQNNAPTTALKAFRVGVGAPGFVTNVSAYTAASDGVRLYWNRTKEVGNGVIAHQISYNREDTPKETIYWQRFVVDRGDTNTALVTGLKPNRKYQFIVYPQSKTMIGVPSATVTATTFKAAPSGPPLNISGIARGSETIEVRWLPPDEEKQNAKITSYQIHYTRKTGRKPIVKNVDGSANHYLLQGLGKYTKYKIWLYAFNEKGRSPKSQIIEVLTKEEVSKGAPHSVRGMALNHSAVAIAWMPPDGYLSASRIVGYKIYGREIFKDFIDQQEHVMEVLGADTNEAIFTLWILGGKKYRFNVAAFTNDKIQTRSKPIYVVTPEKLKPPPIVTMSYNMGINRLSLQWRPNSNDHDNFKIVYGKSLRKYDMLVMKKVKLVGSHTRNSVFDDLSPGLYYCFKVSAELKDESGWTAESVHWVRTAEGLPTGEPLYFEGTTESSSTIRLGWEEPDPWKQNGVIKGYNLRYKTDKDFGWLKYTYNLKAEEDSVIFILENLQPKTRYSLKISAFTDVGSGPYTDIIQVETNKEVLPKVKNLNNMNTRFDSKTGLSSVSIHWNKPETMKKFEDIPFHYQLVYRASKTYRTEEGKMKEISLNKTVPVITEQYLIDDLQPGFEYTISIHIVLKEVGIGDPATIKVNTKFQAPKSIKAPFVNSSLVMTDHMPIYLSAASEIRGPVNHYLLFVVNLEKEHRLPKSLKSRDFGTASPKHNVRRRRRNILENSTIPIYIPDYNIAAFLQRSQLPTLFKLGDGTRKDGYKNERLIPNNFYTTFLRAYVRQDTKYIFTDSKFSSPVRYVPTSPRAGPADNTKMANSGEKSGSPIVLIAGSVAGLLAIVIIVIVAIIFCRRGGMTSEKDRLLRKNSLRDKKSSDPAEIHRQNSNAPGLLRHPPIHVDNLAKEVEILKANGGAKYLQEFESIDPGERPSAEASQLMQNRSKNRYPNVVAFDDTRVKLDFNGGVCSDYINANYIDGYCQKKAYIATQGPLKCTVDDFWRLCWEQNVQTIVMMTKVEERGRSKCEEYWPSKGFENYGNIKVELKEERILCNYCVRTFNVSSTVNSDERTVKHFQYLQWPDPGVPENPGPVLSFMRRVRAHKPPGCGPILVHCSAGVGRSACFIAIDAMLERIRHDNMVDIYGYVTMMRTQRNFMVQTDEQYIFVYDVVVEAIECGNTEIIFTDFAAKFKKLCELNPNHGDTMLERQFKSIAYSQENARIDVSMMAISQSAVNESKNRCRNVIPFDKNRVSLQPLRSHEGSDYINASYINGYERKNAFIATQGPLDNTVSDFWRMIVEQDCNIIVMLTNTEEKGKKLCSEYWPTSKLMRHHYYVIDPMVENRFANFIVREFKITDPRVDKSQVVRQYHYLNWQQGKIPESIEGITEFIGHVQKAYEKSQNNSPIVVHSSTGAGRSGVFIALSLALDSLRKDGYVDLYQIVKGLRYERSFMVQTVEQYEFCFRVINDYMKSFDLVA